MAVLLSNLLSARSLLSHSSKGASKMLRATGHARMVMGAIDVPMCGIVIA